MAAFVILLSLLFVIAFVLGPIGFFLTLGARTRLAKTEGQLNRAETRLAKAERQIVDLRQVSRDLQLRAAADAALARIPVPEPVPPPAETTEPVEEPQPMPTGDISASPQPLEEPEAAPPPVEPITLQAEPVEEPRSAPLPEPPPLPPRAAAAPPRASLEETLGTGWAVWIGGIALGLGALLLVRYSIEQGWFGPGARVLLGLALAAALIAAGEYLRRHDPARNLPFAQDRPLPSEIPAVLTSAGTVAAFGAIYAAHALYGFIGPAFAFVALGAVGLAAMLAAALHGPALAGLGLLGALIAPLLVQSDAPNPWPVALYLTVVIAFAYALARLRLWLWLALCAAAGGFIWGFVLLAGHTIDFKEAALVHGVIETLMATVLFAIVNGAGTADQDAENDPFALFVSSGFAILVLIVLNTQTISGQFGTGWIVGAGATIAILAIGGLLAPTAAGLLLAAGVMLALCLLIWPVAANLPVFPSDAWFQTWPHPKSDSTFATFAGIGAAGLALLSGKRLFDGLSLRAPIATIYAGAAGLIPLAVLVIAYMRLAHSEINLPFAVIAGGLAFAFLIAANFFFSRDAAQTHPILRLGLGAFASAALAALALGLVFALDRGMLTVALALAALGAAFVDRRLDIGALRWCVAGLGLIIAARLLYEPRIVGADLGTTPIFNWLLWGYGVPAAAFAVAAQLLHRRGQDVPVLVAQALSILFFALLFFFEIRHAINNGDPFAKTSSLIEQGLFATVAFGFSLVLTRLDVTQTSPVLRYASLGFGIISFATSLFGLLLSENPLWSGEPLEGGFIFNSLWLGYGLPALMAFWLGRAAQGIRPDWYWQGARVASLVLIFAFLNLELRHLFQGADLTWIDWHYGLPAPRHTTDTEVYCYSALWLLLSILFLAYGLWRASVVARIASAVLMLMTILKVFLFDLNGLTGVIRALSFIGLGLVLIGIGLVYQRLVFAPRRP